MNVGVTSSTTTNHARPRGLIPASKEQTSFALGEFAKKPSSLPSLGISRSRAGQPFQPPATNVSATYNEGLDVYDFETTVFFIL